MGGIVGAPDTFAPSDVIHLFVMEIDLDLSMGVLDGAAAPAALDDDEVGEFSDEELIELPKGDDEQEQIVIDNLNDTTVQANQAFHHILNEGQFSCSMPVC